MSDPWRRRVGIESCIDLYSSSTLFVRESCPFRLYNSQYLCILSPPSHFSTTISYYRGSRALDLHSRSICQRDEGQFSADFPSCGHTLSVYTAHSSSDIISLPLAAFDWPSKEVAMSTSVQSSQLKVCWFVTILKDGINSSAPTLRVSKLADLTSAYYKGK